MDYCGARSSVSCSDLARHRARASGATGPTVTVPRLIQITGVFQPVDGQPPAPVEIVTLSIYEEPDGGLPVWQEQQTVAIERTGRFTLLLGGTYPEGIPAEVFGSGQAQWMSLLFERAGEAEQARVRIASVPYALRASDAETLGGLPAAAYLLAPTADRGGRAASGPEGLSVSGPVPGTSDLVLAGTTNFLAKYVNSADVGDSAVYDRRRSCRPERWGSGRRRRPTSLHLRFTNTGGQMTGLAVQNLGSTATSYSGMLFYDHNGALGQFQGFNNLTHEYRINNIARNGSSVLDGSINFMTGSTSRFFVRSNGNIGIGTTAPSALLEVSNAVPGGPANMWMTSYTDAVGPYYMARRARGTPGAPTAVQSGDGLSGIYGQGYGATAFGPAFTGGMTVQAAQNWTDTAQGTALTFTTTSISATSPTTRMTLDATGNLGIGTSPCRRQVLLEVSNASNSGLTGTLVATTVRQQCDRISGASAQSQRNRGESSRSAGQRQSRGASPRRGYGSTGFALNGGGMQLRAAENWTDTAQGIALDLRTTATGTNTPTTRMTITSNGNLGLGTTAPSAAVEVVRDGINSTLRSTA